MQVQDPDRSDERERELNMKMLTSGRGLLNYLFQKADGTVEAPCLVEQQLRQFFQRQRNFGDYT